MSTRKLEGGLAASFMIRNRLVSSNRTGGSTSSLTAQEPFCSGVIPELKNDFSVASPSDFEMPLGVPGWDTGELPGTSNVVIGFRKGTNAANAGFVALNAADVKDILDSAMTENEAIWTVQDAIDRAVYITDEDGRVDDIA